MNNSSENKELINTIVIIFEEVQRRKQFQKQQLIKLISLLNNETNNDIDGNKRKSLVIFILKGCLDKTLIVSKNNEPNIDRVINFICDFIVLIDYNLDCITLSLDTNILSLTLNRLNLLLNQLLNTTAKDKTVRWRSILSSVQMNYDIDIDDIIKQNYIDSIKDEICFIKFKDVCCRKESSSSTYYRVGIDATELISKSERKNDDSTLDFGLEFGKDCGFGVGIIEEYTNNVKFTIANNNIYDLPNGDRRKISWKANECDKAYLLKGRGIYIDNYNNNNTRTSLLNLQSHEKFDKVSCITSEILHFLIDNAAKLSKDDVKYLYQRSICSEYFISKKIFHPFYNSNPIYDIIEKIFNDSKFSMDINIQIVNNNSTTSNIHTIIKNKYKISDDTWIYFKNYLLLDTSSSNDNPNNYNIPVYYDDKDRYNCVENIIEDMILMDNRREEVQLFCINNKITNDIVKKYKMNFQIELYIFRKLYIQCRHQILLNDEEVKNSIDFEYFKNITPNPIIPSERIKSKINNVVDLFEPYMLMIQERTKRINKQNCLIKYLSCFYKQSIFDKENKLIEEKQDNLFYCNTCLCLKPELHIHNHHTLLKCESCYDNYYTTPIVKNHYCQCKMLCCRKFTVNGIGHVNNCCWYKKPAYVYSSNNSSYSTSYSNDYASSHRDRDDYNRSQNEVNRQIEFSNQLHNNITYQQNIFQNQFLPPLEQKWNY